MIQLLFPRTFLLTLLGTTLFSNLVCMEHSPNRSNVLVVRNSAASSASCGDYDLFLEKYDELSSDSDEENEDQENKGFNQIPRQYSVFVGRAGLQIFNDVSKALNFIRVFNFNALKRNDVKLEKLYMKILDILKLEAGYGDKAYLYFQDWQTDNLIMNWYATERFFVDRITRVGLKVNLFEALNFLEKTIPHLHCKTMVLENGSSKLDQLHTQFKRTLKYIAQRLCAQT